MTNYERLQRLTETELAEWVSQHIDCPLCPVSRLICAANDTCIQAWIDYLTEEESEYLKQKKKLVSFFGLSLVTVVRVADTNDPQIYTI